MKDFCIHYSVSLWPWLNHQLCFLTCGVEVCLMSLVAPLVSVSEAGLGRGEAVTTRCEQRQGTCGHVCGGQGGAPTAPPSHWPLSALPPPQAYTLTLLAPALPVSPRPASLPATGDQLLPPPPHWKMFLLPSPLIPCLVSNPVTLFFSVLLYFLTVVSAPPLRWFS